jgi:HD-like signal output (HDOD) protein
MDPALAHRILSTLSTVEYLSSTPDVSMKLLSKVKDENASMEDLAAVILPSPSLSASLLRLANSVFYSRGAQITTVSHALVHLGLTAVVNYVFAIEMMNTFHADRVQSGFDAAQFWKCSLSGALLAQELALKAGVDEVETVFLSGLLRDMGVLVLRQYFQDIFSDICGRVYKGGVGFNDACKTACGLDHQAIAFILAGRWGLPRKIAAIFQPPTDASPGYAQAMAARNIVLFSDYLLKNKKVFQWDRYTAADPAIAVLTYIAAEEIDPIISKIVSEVNEFFNIF